MLTIPELRRWVSHFGVPEHQVRRDHLLSHVLHALGHLDNQSEARMVFIGGTALCRTHLPDWRLSEDIDLLAQNPKALTARLRGDLPRLLRRVYPGATVAIEADHVGMAGTIDHDELRLRIQVIPLDSSHRRYPTAVHDVALRFADLPAQVSLETPTATAAAAMKLNAWAERAAPRDLCDLFGLAERGFLDDAAVSIATDTGWRPARWMFANDRTPSASAWQSALGHQMADLPDPSRAMTTVRACAFGD